MKKFTLTLMTIGLGAASASAAANLVKDGGFESPIISVTAQRRDLGFVFEAGAWTVVSGNVDQINGYWEKKEGSQSLDLSGQERGTISQGITTVAGQEYALSFWMSGNPVLGAANKIVQVSFGTGSSRSFTYSIEDEGNSRMTMNWKEIECTFTAHSSYTVLTFKDVSEGANACGVALDGVVLTEVPEPASIAAGALLLLPVGSGALRLLRRRTA